ncbi:MAG: CDP-alcohol phosphatidyltransferase family protein [Terriglobales bacterium]
MDAPATWRGSAAAARWSDWLTPANVVTELRLVSVPVVVAAVLDRAFGWALFLALAAGLSDGLDGWLARHLPRPAPASQLGEYLDPIADKLLLSSLFVALSLAGALPWLLTILVFTRDLSIVGASLTVYWRTGFRDFRPTYVGKANTVAEMATVALALLNHFHPAAWSWQLEWLGWGAIFALTYGSGIHYAFVCARRYHGWRAETGRLAA